jgi:hypothetical protein
MRQVTLQPMIGCLLLLQRRPRMRRHPQELWHNRENSPCCPSTYRTPFNPSLNKPLCPDYYFCQYDETLPKYPGLELLKAPPGTCLRNAPDCGKLGKPCCIVTTANTGGEFCNPEDGKKGFCAGADGATKGVKDKDLICHSCPASGCPTAG